MNDGCTCNTYMLDIGIIFHFGPRPYNVLKDQTWIGIISISEHRAIQRGFKCCPAVARIAKALPAAAAGEALASDIRHAVGVHGPALIGDQLLEQVSELALREVVEDNRVRKAGRHALVVLH